MDSLRSLIEERLKEKFGRRVSWQDIIDEQLMRGSQNKWSHIVARTLNRPRDVIQFLNVALRTAKRRNDPSIVLLNEDIVNSRTDYSAYFKREFDDEILPHWPQWEEALHSLSYIGTDKFDVAQFQQEYQKRRSAANLVDPLDALRILHRFSVIGYETRSGYGGSGWAFMYVEPDRGWDAHATKFKVHPGLKEAARLREEQVS